MKFLRHLLRHREAYFWVPLCLLGIFLAIVFVNSLTGRQVVDDPGSIVGYLYSSFRVVLIVFITGQVQEHFFHYRSERFSKAPEPKEVPLSADLVDAVTTFALLFFFAWIIQ